MSDRLSYVTLRYHKMFHMGVQLGLSVHINELGKIYEPHDTIYKGKSESTPPKIGPTAKCTCSHKHISSLLLW